MVLLSFIIGIGIVTHYHEKETTRTAKINKEFNYHQSGYLRELINKYKTLLSFGNFEFEKQYFHNLIQENKISNTKKSFLKTLFLNLILLLGFTMKGIILIFGAYIIKDNVVNKVDTRGINGVLTFQAGHVITFLLSIFTIEVYIKDIFVYFNDLSETINGAKGYYELDQLDKIKTHQNYNLIELPELPQGRINQKYNLSPFSNEIQIKNISFVNVCFDYDKLYIKENHDADNNLKCKQTKGEAGYDNKEYNNKGIMHASEKRINFDLNIDQVRSILSRTKKKRSIKIATKQYERSNIDIPKTKEKHYDNQNNDDNEKSHKKLTKENKNQFENLIKNISFNSKSENSQEEINYMINFNNKENIKNFYFENLNITFETKRINYLIGKSGTGKTSILALILKLFNPTKGNILINNVDIQKINDNDYYKLISYVPQESIFYDLSVKDNIIFFQNDIKDEKIFQVIEKLKMDKFINNLKYGIDTKIGQNGSEISGGQRQLISIARALVKNPKIILLDEFTSNFDNILSKEIFSLLDSISENIIVIIVTHHLKMIDLNNQKNKIIFIENGMVKEISLESLKQNIDNNLSNSENSFVDLSQNLLENDELYCDEIYLPNSSNGCYEKQIQEKNKRNSLGEKQKKNRSEKNHKENLERNELIVTKVTELKSKENEKYFPPISGPKIFKITEGKFNINFSASKIVSLKYFSINF